MDELFKRLTKINNRVEHLSDKGVGSVALCIKDNGNKLYELANAFMEIAILQDGYIKQLETRCAQKWMQSKTFNEMRADIINTVAYWTTRTTPPR
jgi:hypothetical protein